MRWLLLIAVPAVLLVPGCAADPKDKAAREWQRAECNRVIDPDAREKCLKRVE